MYMRKSGKIVVFVVVVILTVSAMGVIPSETVYADSYLATDLEVGQLLEPGDKIDSSGLQFLRVMSGIKFKDSTNFNMTYLIHIESYKLADSWLEFDYADGLPELGSLGYDKWKVVYSKNYGAGQFIMCAPVKEIEYLNQPASINTDYENPATFSTSATNILSPSSIITNEWYAAKVKPYDQINFNGKRNSSGNIGDSTVFTIDTKSILSFDQSIKSFESIENNPIGNIVLSIKNAETNDVVYTSTKSSIHDITKQFVLDPGKYLVECEWEMINGYTFSIFNGKLTELTPVGTGDTLTIDKNNPHYKNGAQFLTIANNKRISDIATLTINDPKADSPETSITDISKTSVLEKIHAPTKTYYLKTKQSMTIPVSAYKADGTMDKLTFTSNNKKIATVNSKTGRVNAKKTGTATITAKASSGEKYKFKIKVTKKATKVKKLYISGAPKSMKVGDIKYLSLKAKPAKATKVVAKWTSNKKSVISVDKTGRIVAKKAGKAKISAKIGKKTVTKTITVK